MEPQPRVAWPFDDTAKLLPLPLIEEERRVLYVALTRAQDELIITRRDGNHYTADVEGRNAETAYFLKALQADIIDE